jgi:LacI family transcriptional regulator
VSRPRPFAGRQYDDRVQRPTIRDVAAAAGISTATVSHVLNRPELVAAGTRERVQLAIDQLGFVRNSSARRLSDGRSRTVGLVVQDGSNPFFAEVARGVEDAVSGEGYLVILCNSANSLAREERHLRLLEEQRTDGVLISPVGSEEPTLLPRLRDGGASVVILYRHSRRRDRCSVAVDDAVGARLAGEHLIELGHRRIGLISGPLVNRTLLDRRINFLARLDEAGIAVAPSHDLPAETTSIVAGEAATTRLLARKRRPSALFCGNDLLALGALRAALLHGLSVPDDLAVVGYDDQPLAALSLVPLTSIRQPIYEIGRRAGELFLDDLHRGADHRHRHVLFKPELVARESTIGRQRGEPHQPAFMSSR